MNILSPISCQKRKWHKTKNDNDSNNPNCHLEDYQRKWHKIVNHSKYQGARWAIIQPVGAGYGPNYITAWLYIEQDMWGENWWGMQSAIRLGSLPLESSLGARKPRGMRFTPHSWNAMAQLCSPGISISCLWKEASAVKEGYSGFTLPVCDGLHKLIQQLIIGLSTYSFMPQTNVQRVLKEFLRQGKGEKRDVKWFLTTLS